MTFLRRVFDFIRDVAADPSIPTRDKQVILALLVLIISPLDLIPDWIPIFGVLDDIVMLALVMDYFFNVLDDQILLRHYPAGMKSFEQIRRIGRWIAILSPGFLKRCLWVYVAPPY